MMIRIDTHVKRKEKVVKCVLVHNNIAKNLFQEEVTLLSLSRLELDAIIMGLASKWCDSREG